MKTIVVAPHPDDEVLGAGGTLLRRANEGHSVAWLIVTAMSPDGGWSQDQIARRAKEIKDIAAMFSFAEVYELNYATTLLDTIPAKELVHNISNVFKDFEPEEIFIPHWGDVHSDHRAVFSAVSSSSKWFRNSTVKRIFAYETPSETNFSLVPSEVFIPNTFVDISSYLELKIEAMKTYKSEIGVHPFPRSEESIRALATIRGAESGFNFAESFQLVRQII
jgi:LmbE family N-acetylglucosaminyl deacetylase